MPREVEGLKNLNRILELPLGSKFGMFVDGSMNAFKVAGYLDRVAKASGDPFNIATVTIPSYPLVRMTHVDSSRDIVYEAPRSGLMRVLYERDLKGPIEGIPWHLNRAAILPRYLYDVGCAPCFDACFVFLDRPVGSVVTEHDEQRLTETFFVSMNELNNAKL